MTREGHDDGGGALGNSASQHRHARQMREETYESSGSVEDREIMLPPATTQVSTPPAGYEYRTSGVADSDDIILPPPRQSYQQYAVATPPGGTPRSTVAQPPFSGDVVEYSHGETYLDHRRADSIDDDRDRDRDRRDWHMVAAQTQPQSRWPDDGGPQPFSPESHHRTDQDEKPGDEVTASPSQDRWSWPREDGADVGGILDGFDPIRFVISHGPGRFPCCAAFVTLLIVVVIITVGIVSMPPEIETDFDDFVKTDVHASVLYDAFLAALEDRENTRRLVEGESEVSSEELRAALGLEEVEEDDASPDFRRTQGTVNLFKTFDLFIAYELNSENNPTYDNIFHQDVLDWIKEYEESLINLASWQDLCNQTFERDSRLCQHGINLVNYAFPTEEFNNDSVVPTTWIFDRASTDMVPLSSALQMARSQNVDRFILPENFQTWSVDEIVESPSQVAAIRSAFRFRLYCCSTSDSLSSQKSIVEQMRKDWEALLEDHLLDMLESPVEDKENWIVRVWYDGDEIARLEVLRILWTDIQLASGSMAFVLLYLLIHTQSVFLSIAALITIIMSVPLSYVVFAFLSGTQSMSIASFLSLFLVVGLGADVVFVYTDFWRLGKDHSSDIVGQMTFTGKFAGKASLATTVVTALSFFANLASVIRALREFGVYMGLCVVFVWVLVSCVYLSLLAVDEIYLSRFRINCFRCCGSSGSSFFHSWVYFLFPWRKWVLGASVFLGIVFLGFGTGFAQVDGSFPNIFPSSHNQNRGIEVMETFVGTDVAWSDIEQEGNVVPPVASQTICSPFNLEAAAEDCPLHWCEAQPTSSQLLLTQTCGCYRSSLTSCVNGTSTTACTANMRIVTDLAPTSVEVATTGGNHLLSTTSDLSFGSATLTNYVSSQPAVAPVLQQEWLTGDVLLMDVADYTFTMIRDTDSAPCVIDEVCFCNSYECVVNPNFPYSGQFSLQRRLRRKLQTTTTTVRYRTDVQVEVDVVFGIEVAQGTPLLGERPAGDRWDFLSTFDAAQPWGQRNLLSLCTEVAQELLVVKADCWIVDFRDWLLNKGEKFPVLADSFVTELDAFKSVGITGDKTSQDYLWTRDSELKACFMKFRADFSTNSGLSDGLAYMDKWDSYISAFNDEASVYATGVFHVSNYWVQIQATKELIETTVVTLVLVIGLAFIGMLIFTFNIILSLFVVITTVLVILGLTFFITCVAGWKIGVIEVIALIVFIGYAETYSLHVAHKYGDRRSLAGPIRTDLQDEEAIRFQRTLFSLTNIGGAALGSAVTTVGSSIFLLFCQLTIFTQLGGVIMAVTALSIVAALVTLPTMLLCSGPLRSGCIGRDPPRTDHLQDKALDFQETLQDTLQDVMSTLSSPRRAPWHKSEQEPATADDVSDSVAAPGQPVFQVEDSAVVEHDVVARDPTAEESLGSWVTAGTAEAERDLKVHSWNNKEFFL